MIERKNAVIDLLREIFSQYFITNNSTRTYIHTPATPNKSDQLSNHQISDTTNIAATIHHIGAKIQTKINLLLEISSSFCNDFNIIVKIIGKINTTIKRYILIK
jgi:hypothetical protein